jgi:tRNA nucleotidyltransferase (CCA-adding enzyme)
MLISEESSPMACFRRMQQFKLFQAIHPLLSLDNGREDILEESEKVLAWYRLLYLEPKPEPWKLFFLGFTAGCTPEQTQEIIGRFHFSKRHEKEFLALRQTLREAIGKVVAWQGRGERLSDLYFILEAIPVEGVLYLMARSQKELMRKHVSLFLTQLRNQKIDITGGDLKELGLEPGPLFGQILARVKAAKLDGQAACRSTQLELAVRIAEEIGPHWGREPVPGA